MVNRWEETMLLEFEESLKFEESLRGFYVK